MSATHTGSPGKKISRSRVDTKRIIALLLIPIISILTICPAYAENSADYTLYYAPGSIHQGDVLTLYGTAPLNDGEILDFRIYSNNNKKPTYYAAKEVYSGNFSLNIDTEDISNGNYTIQVYYKDSIKASADMLLLQKDEVTVNILPKNGALRIYSTPGNASVYIDGNFVGITEINKGLQINGVTPGNHIVILTKSGYRNQSQTAAVYPDMLNEINFYLSKIPTNGTLSICSYPSEADVYLGNEFIGETDDIFTNLAPGIYHLQLWKEIDGSDPNSSSFEDRLYNYEDEIEIKAGEITTIFANMEEMRQPTVMEVKTIPNFAEIYIDGMYVGDSDIVLNPIAEGDHTIYIFKPGYSEYNGTINIPAGGLSFKMTLTPVCDIGKLLIVKSNPSELPIYIDGKYRGKTPESVTGLDVGRHEVRVKNGETEWEGIIETIQPGSVTAYADFSQEELTETETPAAEVEENDEEDEEEFSEEDLLKMYGLTKQDEDEEEQEHNTPAYNNENKTIIDSLVEFIADLSPF
ncbi:PEGA domain protein [Methanolacinia petrolearia DSM 11571]|uniref:PEGA domain protein n=1 Tax=Methanolacinia petrolearia (strain DSM 11571 / OCM 486 / SEBR 4847) TaxID=679926 RepID=E1RFS5_METP4|nr:PEGA domain-containing protein [Methanolacinia petrolearia]ADN37379.1 PEGA domain protein [Methanolacinia petrolearia DSM 11571]